MSEAAKRSQALANDLARRAIEAAERRRAEEAAPDPAETLRELADEDGRVSLDAALEALGAERTAPLNPFAAQLQKAEAPPPQPPEPEPEQFGDIDAGKGEVPDGEYEAVATDAGVELMRVFDLDNPDDERNPE